MTLHLDASNPADIERAAELLRNGQLVAIPTETVYGLAARVFDQHAVEDIFRVKGRPADNPLIVHCATVEQVETVAHNIPDVAWRLLERFAPGPLTLVLERRPEVPAVVSAGLDTVAVRIPGLEVTRRVIEAVGEPLAAPSANRSGRPSPTRAEHVLDDLGGLIAAVLDGGPSPIGIESTVLKLVGDVVILRPGAITAADLAPVLGFEPPYAQLGSTDVPLAPGMKYRHYAPKAPVILIRSLEELPSMQNAVVLSTQPLSGSFEVRPLSRSTLYEEFRRADRLQRQAIYVLVTPDVEADVALMNRLLKAAATE